MEKALEDSLWEIKKKYQEILEDLKKDEVLSNIKQYTKLTKEANSIKDIVVAFDQYLNLKQNIIDSKLLLNEKDEEIEKYKTFDKKIYKKLINDKTKEI